MCVHVQITFVYGSLQLHHAVYMLLMCIYIYIYAQKAPLLRGPIFCCFRSAVYRNLQYIRACAFKINLRPILVGSWFWSCFGLGLGLASVWFDVCVSLLFSSATLSLNQYDSDLFLLGLCFALHPSLESVVKVP